MGSNINVVISLIQQFEKGECKKYKLNKGYSSIIQSPQGAIYLTVNKRRDAKS